MLGCYYYLEIHLGYAFSTQFIFFVFHAFLFVCFLLVMVMSRLLQGLRNATLPAFHNLIHLELGVSGGWDFLSNLLSSAPNLETLVFAEGLLEPDDDSPGGFCSFYWHPPESPPACLLQHLKEIEIHNIVGRPCERFIIRYLLHNGLVLENMDIYWCNPSPRLTKF